MLAGWLDGWAQWRYIRFWSGDPAATGPPFLGYSKMTRTRKRQPVRVFRISKVTTIGIIVNLHAEGKAVATAGWAHPPGRAGWLDAAASAPNELILDVDFRTARTGITLARRLA